MATSGQPGGGGAKGRKPGNVGSTERLEGGSWIAIVRGGCGSIYQQKNTAHQMQDHCVLTGTTSNLPSLHPVHSELRPLHPMHLEIR